MPSWIGPWEIAVVLVLALLIFGPRKLPELGSSLGKSIRGFKRGMKDGHDEVDQTVAEVKEATSVSDSPLVQSQRAEAPATSEAATVAAAATATAELPKCWSTWEDGHEACLQCSVAARCAEAGPGTPDGE